MREVDRDQAAHDFMTMDQRVATSPSVTNSRFFASLFTIFGALAILLAMVGVYGVMSWVVGQRTSEFGIRMALGARARDVVAMLLAQSLRPILIGVVLGALGRLRPEPRAQQHVLAHDLGRPARVRRHRGADAGGGPGCGLGARASRDPDRPAAGAAVRVKTRDARRISGTSVTRHEPPDPRSIHDITARYETWLRTQTKVVKRDLDEKHAAMSESPFPFLRATYYAWAVLWPAALPELAQAPRVTAIGDLHIENFGTWRDAEGRLAWGINDFDEAATLPYTNDLVRLATSASPCL